MTVGGVCVRDSRNPKIFESFESGSGLIDLDLVVKPVVGIIDLCVTSLSNQTQNTFYQNWAECIF